MSKASEVLFGTGGGAEDVTGIDEVLAAAEAAYKEHVAGGGGDEEVEVEVDGGDDNAGSDDDGDGEVVDDGAGAGDEESDGGDAGDDGSGGDSDAEADAVTAEAEAALRFANQRVAEQAYEELRAEFNRVLNDRQQQAPAVQAPVVPAVDARQLVQQAAQDPVSAFNAALEAGELGAVNQIVATVATDAAVMAQRAALAAEEGDAENAAVYQQRAQNATLLAEEMRSHRSRVEYGQQLAKQMEPVQNDRLVNALEGAARRAMSQPVFQSVAVTPEQQLEIGQVIQANPHVMGDGSPAAMEAGFTTAAAHVLFGGQQGMIDHLVQMRVDAEIAQHQPGRVVSNKARGTAGGSGRRAPASSQGGEDGEVAEVQQVGSRVPSGMGVLFNR